MKQMIPNPHGVTVDWSLISPDYDWRNELYNRSFCQCCSCGDYFKSPTGFAKHLVRDELGMIVRCMTPNEMIGIGMKRNESQMWITEELDHLYYKVLQYEKEQAMKEEEDDRSSNIN